jgi:hypothetical protein
MAEERIHRIEDDLGEGWLADFTEEGFSAIETYLEKHAAFLAYLDSDDS